MKLQIPIPLLLFYFVILNSAVAQIPTEAVNAKSPNAATLGLFGETPVSYFLGLPNIEVPLYTLSTSGITVPIGLNYHASGFRPDMHPGWTGLGWSCSGISVISRTVKDAPDEYDNKTIPFSEMFEQELGYYFRETLNGPAWNETGYMKAVASYPQIDSESDEFSFSFGNYSGSFYLDANHTWKVKCDKPLKVSFNGVFSDIPSTSPYDLKYSRYYGNTKSFYGFTITTEDGTQYIFGNDLNAIEYSINFFEQNDQLWEWIADSWFLTKIISPLQNEVTFTYERDDFINQLYVAVSGSITLGSVYVGDGLGTIDCSKMTTGSGLPNQHASGKLISPVYLAKIQTETTIVDFKRSTSTELRYENSLPVYENIYNARLGGAVTDFEYLSYLYHKSNVSYPDNLNVLQWKKLDQIIIKPVSGASIKTFNFTYNNNPNERLMLLSVAEQGSESIEAEGGSYLNKIPPYQFFYDTSMPLPGYFANMNDHWGFYNCTNADLNDKSTYYSKREPSASCLFPGTLNKIVFPTGGVTEFLYQPHDYGKQLQLDRSKAPQNTGKTLAGGLRIAKISSYDLSNPTKKNEKEFFYVKDYANAKNVDLLESSGVMGGQISYTFNYILKATVGSGTYFIDYFSSQSVLPGCVNAMGSHVGYSQVVEKRSDGSYTRYYFSNYDTGQKDEQADNVLQQTLTEYEPYNSTEQERGKLIKEEHYNAANKIISSRQILHQAIPSKATSFVKSLKVQVHFPCNNAPSALAIEAVAYKLYYYSYLPIQERTTLYDQEGNNGMTTIKNFSYDDNKLQTGITVTNSRGEQLATEYKYPFQMAANESAGGIYHAMVSKNILSPVVEEKHTKGVNVTFQKKNNYTEPFTGKYLVTSVEANSGKDYALENKVTIAYDDRGNQVAMVKPSGPTSCYVWGYGGQYPVAKIDNANYESVVTTLGGSSEVKTFRDNLNPTNIVVNSFLNTLRNGLPNALITTYTYAPLLGMTTMTDANNKTTYYVYDPMGRLLLLKDFEGNVIKMIHYNYKVDE